MTYRKVQIIILWNIKAYIKIFATWLHNLPIDLKKKIHQNRKKICRMPLLETAFPQILKVQIWLKIVGKSLLYKYKNCLQFFYSFTNERKPFQYSIFWLWILNLAIEVALQMYFQTPASYHLEHFLHDRSAQLG